MWKSAELEIQLDTETRSVIKSNNASNGYDSIASQASFEEFVLDTHYWAKHIISNFDEKVYTEILNTVKGFCSQDFIENIDLKEKQTALFLQATPEWHRYFLLLEKSENIYTPEKPIEVGNSYCVNGESSQLIYSFNNQGSFKIVEKGSEKVIHETEKSDASKTLRGAIYFEKNYFLSFYDAPMIISETGEICCAKDDFSELLELFQLLEWIFIDNQPFIGFSDRTANHAAGYFGFDLEAKGVKGRINRVKIKR